MVKGCEKRKISILAGRVLGADEKVMPPRGITFPVRKRRAVEHLEVKPPSDRITLKKMPASLVAKLDRPSAKGDHSNQLQDQEEKEHLH